MSSSFSGKTDRKKIAIRLLYTVLAVIAFEICKFIIYLTSAFQYLYLLLTTEHNEPIRKFSNKTSVYGYRLMRFITLNESIKPYPFTDFPEEIEPPDHTVIF